MEKKKNSEEFDQNEDLALSFAKSQDKNEFLEILGKLFEKENIELITDLSEDEIKLITRIKTLADLKNYHVYKNAVLYYMELRLSTNRKSRREIVDAVKGYMMGMKTSRGLLGGIFGRKDI